MTQPYTPSLLTLLREHTPPSVLAVGEACREPVAQFQAEAPHSLCTIVPPSIERQALMGYGRYALGLVIGVLEYRSRAEGSALLAQLRDLQTPKLALVVAMERATEHTSEWHSRDFLGLGMKLMAKYELAGLEHHAYTFDIASYKHTPDWLNPKFWANPALWDQYRW